MIVLRKRITLLLCKKKVLRASIERTKRIIYLDREGSKANEEVKRNRRHMDRDTGEFSRPFVSRWSENFTYSKIRLASNNR